MKSVIVQGATIAKAIDEALAKAGMPQEFFVKVLEEAQPGFLGFGSKKAKIVLFFKKDINKRDGSLLSRGAYKNLFENENLQAQSIEQEKQQKVVEKKEVTPLAPQPRKENVQQQQQRKAEVAQQPRKVEQQPRKPEPKPVEKQEQKTSTPQRVPVQRPLNQRPLKNTTQKTSDVVSVVTPVEKETQQILQNNVLESAAPTDVVRTEPQKRRPRRRRHYGYRSKAPLQWRKDQDGSEQQSSDERSDSESK